MSAEGNEPDYKNASFNNKLEREFLHAIATPIAIAMGQLEALVEECSASGALPEAQQTRLAKAQKALNKVRDLMEARRTVVRAASTALANADG